MGDCFHYCAISGLPIGNGEKVVSFLIASVNEDDPTAAELGEGGFKRWKALSLPMEYIVGDYTPIQYIRESIKDKSDKVLNVLIPYMREKTKEEWRKGQIISIPAYIPNWSPVEYTWTVCSIRKDIWDYMLNYIKSNYNLTEWYWYNEHKNVIDTLWDFKEKLKAIPKENEKEWDELFFTSRRDYNGKFSHRFAIKLYEDEIKKGTELGKIFLDKLHELHLFYYACMVFDKNIIPNYSCSQDNWYGYIKDKTRLAFNDKVKEIEDRKYKDMEGYWD